MGIKTQTRKQAKPVTAWLPGFEPEGFLAENPLQGLASFAPDVTPTPVAVVSAAVVHAVMSQVPTAQDAFRMTDILKLNAEGEAVSVEATTPAVLEEVSVASVKSWPTFDPSRYTPGSNVQSRIAQNIRAIELLLELRKQPRPLTDDDRHTLLAYCGWGGAARMFEEHPGNSHEEQRQKLAGMVTPHEYASARASTTSAYFTEPSLIDVIWKMIRRLGFNGGKVIEPAAGTGLFLAHMPHDIAVNSDITAVEMDTLTAGILDKVFAEQGVKVHCSPIEKAPVPDGYYDLAVSNVPFGEHRSLETRKVGYADYSIHNYVIAKSIDLVRPGGLVVVITSSFTMESERKSHRDWINSQAELLGAFRLPDNAFKKSAATQVVTDILVLKKRNQPQFTATCQWAVQVQAPEALLRPGQALKVYSQPYRRDVDRHVPINEWYVKHPLNVLGQLVLETAQYGRTVVNTVASGDVDALTDRLDALVDTLPSDAYRPVVKAKEAEAAPVFEQVAATHAVKPGAYVLHKGRICMGQDTMNWIDVDDAFKGKARERIIGMIGVREVTRRLIDQQVQSDDDVAFKGLQSELNIKYDAFVAKHGNVHDTANFRVFRNDPDCPLLLSLEVFDEDADVYRKADIFSKRTAGRRQPPERADNVKDAMLISMGVYGRIHVGDMSKRLGVTPSEVVKGLKDEGLAYVDPADDRWKPADEYLSGHIRKKIAVAEAAGKAFERNVQALTNVLPKDLGPGEVEVRLGAPWVPISIVHRFACELVEIKDGTDLCVTYNEAGSTWGVTSSGHGDMKYLGNRVLNTSKWGTNDRCALRLIEAALNQVPPKITYTDIDDRTRVDKPRTMAAREKMEAIRHEFKAWAYRDPDRRDELLKIYNAEFNQIVDRQYDGSHLVLYGMSKVIVPYQHQLDAIWRIVSGGNCLLAHVVGAGKTFTMIAAAMEMRRLGKAHKPLIITPNHLLTQVAGDCVRFYPNAKILMASKDDLHGDKRMEFCARIASGSWDAVVMTQSTFERLPTGPEKTQRFMDELLAEVRSNLLKAEESKAKRTIKQCEKMLKSLEAKVTRALNEDGKDDLVFFESLGIDYIFLDEAHSVKNLMRVSKMPSIAGLSNASSNRAFDAWVKTSLIMAERGGQEGVCYSTATPISNSLAEMYTMQKFLQPETLKQHGLYEFDAWSATFGESVTSMEISPDGGGYRLATRYSRFTNVPEMMALFKQVADIRTRAMVKLPTPDIRSGKPIAICSPASDSLLEYTATLVERAEAIRSGLVKPEEDNMLAVTGCGRKAALDMRLVDPTLPFDPKGKVAQAVENIMRIWLETADQRGTQLVFCDLSTPSKVGFSVYNDLRQRLIDAGMPASEIEFIHDHDSDMAKDKLFRAVRSGRVRVLMGSTSKLGTGTNVQKRLKCVHQLDAPWRPSDVEQRDGRGLRAGNMWGEIELLRYVTEKSFDSYIWSLLETKAKFIDQVFSGSGLRSVEDLAMGALTFAEIKAIASGNPLVLEKATVDADVMKLTTLKSQWEQDRWAMGNRARSNAELIQTIEQSMGAVEADAAQIAAEIDGSDPFKPVGGWSDAAKMQSSIEGRIGAEIWFASKTFTGYGTKEVGTIGGMSLLFVRGHSVDVVLKSNRLGGPSYVVRRAGRLNDVFDTGAAVLSEIRGLIDEPRSRVDRLARMKRDIEDINAACGSGFEHEERLAQLVLRQREIEAALDLDKDEAGVEAVASTETA